MYDNSYYHRPDDCQPASSLRRPHQTAFAVAAAAKPGEGQAFSARGLLVSAGLLAALLSLAALFAR
jgi:hypothetical protein